MLLNLKGTAKLYMATYEDNNLSGIIVTQHGKTATYYYGASSNMHRELKAPSLLQWIAIKDAKSEGIEVYDFLGISVEICYPAPSQHFWDN